MDQILRVNLTTETLQSAPLPSAYRHLGGRALTSALVCAEVDPACDPLGPGNKLIWAVGLVAGTTASSTGRISVGCKSPLTGGIKESSGGGDTGTLLAQAGYRAIVVEGAAPAGTWWVLVVEREGVRLEPAAAGLVGSGSFAAARTLQEQYGRTAAVALCGPAGEQRMMIAGIGNTDREGRPSRLNARGAVGAVMGAKGLKALVVRGNLRQAPVAADPATWPQAVRAYHNAIRENPGTGQRYPKYGTSTTLELVNRLGALPTRNFAAGRFDGADRIGGNHMHDLIVARGGEGLTTHACMTGCAIRCSNVWADASGRELASSLEFETTALLGSNLGIDDLDVIARLTWVCNDLGVDTIETGAALGVAMEAGVLAWGDGAEAERILDQEVRHGTLLGRAIGAGAAVAGRVLGVRRVPVVKGQALAGYDGRAIKGNGVTYCTSPMGGDHTAGNTTFFKVDHLDPAGKVAISREMQIFQTAIDSLGVCTFARGLADTAPEALLALLRTRAGLDWSWDDLRRLGLQIIRQEVDFNRRAGLGVGTDRLPEWMRNEPLPPHDARFDVPTAEMDAIWDEDL